MKKCASLLIAAMSFYIFTSSPVYSAMENRNAARLESARMKNVTATFQSGEDIALQGEPSPTPAGLQQFIQQMPAVGVMSVKKPVLREEKPLIDREEAKVRDETIKETTIEGGLSIKNQTGYQVELGKLLLTEPKAKLPAEGKQILIIHTHASEAYAPAGLDVYEPSDDSRTEDTRYNIVRVGEELCSVFEAAGLSVVHDKNIYDYPSYTGSYNRSGDAVQNWLAEYPEIGVIIDVHRDALGENGVVYKTMAEEDGVCASQLMLLAGSDESGLEHPGWQDNLALAIYLQRFVSAAHPTLMRPVELVPQRYNQHLSPGSLILEVGSSGNTLQEALAAARLFGRAAAPALKALVR